MHHDPRAPVPVPVVQVVGERRYSRPALLSSASTDPQMARANHWQRHSLHVLVTRAFGVRLPGPSSLAAFLTGLPGTVSVTVRSCSADGCTASASASVRGTGMTHPEAWMRDSGKRRLCCGIGRSLRRDGRGTASTTDPDASSFRCGCSLRTRDVASASGVYRCWHGLPAQDEGGTGARLL